MCLPAYNSVVGPPLPVAAAAAAVDTRRNGTILRGAFSASFLSLSYSAVIFYLRCFLVALVCLITRAHRKISRAELKK